MKPLTVFVAFGVFCASIGVISWLSRPPAADQPLAEDDPEAVATNNPFKISDSGPHPAAAIDEGVYDFGDMVLGEKGKHAFVIRNEGEAPLKLKVQKTTCKCTVPTLPDGGIPPGESAEVILEWETQHASKSYSQHVRLWSNIPDKEVIILQIKGKVASLVQIHPPFPWTVGTIKDDEETTFTGLVLSGRESFNVESIESTQDWLTTEIEPLKTDIVKAYGSELASGYQVTVKIRPEMVIGRFETPLTIHTDIAEAEVAKGTVTGTRAGSFSIIGQSWQGSEMTVRMGEFDSEEGKTVTLSLFAEREEEPLEFKSITVVPDIVKVTTKRDDGFQTPVKEKYDLTFTVPPQTRKGRFLDEDRIDVTLFTNRPDMEEMHLSVEAIIE